jgi:carbon monoxide dehydrogenase subunit G
MKISGTAALKASPQQAWDAFHDPEVLARCLPGCESLTEVGPGEYAMTVTAGVAAIKGTYDGKVALLNPQHPEQFTLKAQGAGGPGTVDADVLVRLAPSTAGGTDLSFDADAAVGGMIGGVGQRMLAGVTRKMAGQFFEAVDDDIAGVRKETKAPEYVAPGVYVEEVPTGGRPIEGVGTSTAAVVGYAERRAKAERRAFGWGVLAGGAVALAGVIVGWAIGGR